MWITQVWDRGKSIGYNAHGRKWTGYLTHSSDLLDCFYAAFIRLCTIVLGNTKTRALLVAAFQELDPQGRGYLTAAEMRGVMSGSQGYAYESPSQGPGLPHVAGAAADRPLPAETIDAVLSFGDPASTGTVDYTLFAARLFEEAARIEKAKVVAAVGEAVAKKPASAKKK